MDLRIISGYLGRDAEKIEINGNEYWKTSIAVKQFQETKWVDVIIYDNGQKRNEYLRKGKVIEVWGRPDYRTWTNRNNDTMVQEVIWVADWRLSDTPRAEEHPEPRTEQPATEEVDSISEAVKRVKTKATAKAEAEEYKPTDLPF